jgi:hypothetical protein
MFPAPYFFIWMGKWANWKLLLEESNWQLASEEIPKLLYPRPSKNGLARAVCLSGCILVRVVSRT